MTAPTVPEGRSGTGHEGERWGRVRVIWNPRSGTKPGIAVPATTEVALRQLIAGAGLGEELHATGSSGEARALALGAVRDGYDLVVAAGGDGTIGTVATELLGSETALGILPLGSVMNVARSLGLPRDLDGAAATLTTGVIRSMDVGEAGDRVFFEAASVGMNAAMFKEAQRFDRGDWSSILRTVWVAIRYRPARMEIQLDDAVLRTRALMVVVANGPYTGLALTVAPQARLDDGRFDVVVFRRFSKLQLLRHLAGIAFGRRQPMPPETDVHRSSVARIRSVHPLPARADSHDLGTTPVAFRVRPGALRVVVPRAEVRPSG